MSIKITIPNSSSDVLTFGSGNTPTAAQIAGIDSGSSNGQLALYTTASGTSTERVRVDSSGNVGIGTSSPVTIGSGYGTLDIRGSNGAGFRWGNSTDSAYTYADSTSTVIATATAKPLTFATNNTERMRIDSSGNLLVRTTSQLSPGGIGGVGNVLNPNNDGSWALALQNNATTTGNGRGIGIRNTTDFNDGNNEFIYCVGNATARMLVRSNGGISNYSANNVNLSDERTKTDIQDANDYLSKICAIPVRTFKYKDQTDDLLNLGCIAQEVEAVAPELVDASGFGETPEDGVPLKAIYQTDLQYALMKCIQEQQAIITSLTDRITALEGAK